MALQHFYVIHSSGMPLLDFSFLKKPSPCNPAFVAGGIVGIVSILNEIVQEKENITQIRHGNYNFLFQMDETHEIIFVLVTNDIPNGECQALKAFTQDFCEEFKFYIKNIDRYCFDCNLWESADYLVRKHFLEYTY